MLKAGWSLAEFYCEKALSATNLSLPIVSG
jgi:hypothetical protein